MIVYLVRHGETSAGRDGLYGRSPGISLSDVGKSQAALLATHLSEQPIAAVYSSPLERALETARPIADARTLSVQTAPAFIEVDQGDWTGMSWPELHKDPHWRLYNAFRSATGCPNGEMAIEIQARVVRALSQLLDTHAQQHVVVVSHADVIRAAVCHYAGIPLDLSLRVEISTASISIVDLRRESVRIVEINRTLPHSLLS